MNEDKQRAIEWNKLCSFVASKMREHVLPYTTPISRALSHEQGEHHGSASYIEYMEKKFILTNDHVSRGNAGCGLTHMFWGLDNVYRVSSDWFSIFSPVDASACLVNQSLWKEEHNSNAIPLSRFAKKHDPIQGELLFFVGYSGDRSKFYFGHLFTTGTPYLTQEIPVPNCVTEANMDYHFALPYKPDKAISIDGGSNPLPRPPGFSGSLVWDTKRMACHVSGKSWSPDMAEITGLVWGWPSSQACILATRVEHLEVSKLLGMVNKYS